MYSKREKIIAAFESLAVVTSHFLSLSPDDDDADDYLETMMVVESLLECGGFNHRDMVARFRRGRPTEIGGRQFVTGNRDARTQMAKLRASKDPFYIARDGITNGAAMRMLGVALYFPNFDEMVFAANAVASITHASENARLAAVMVAVKHRMMFLNENGGNVPSGLERNFNRVCSLLNVRNESPFRQVMKCVFNIRPVSWPDIGGFCQEVNLVFGFMHCATSAPLAAIACAWRERQFLLPSDPHSIGPLQAVEASADTVIRHHREYFDHDIIDVPDWERAFAPTHDADTFYSILAPMVALQYGAALLGENKVFERYGEIADALSARWKQD